jgi:transposase-like protein
LQQNAQAYVTPLDQRKPVAQRIRAIFNAPDRTEAERLLKQAIEAWSADAPKLAQWAEDNLPEGFTAFELPLAQRPRTHQSRDQAKHSRRLYLPQFRVLSAPRLRPAGRVRRGLDDRQNLSQLERLISSSQWNRLRTFTENKLHCHFFGQQRAVRSGLAAPTERRKLINPPIDAVLLVFDNLILACKLPVESADTP